MGGYHEGQRAVQERAGTSGAADRLARGFHDALPGRCARLPRRAAAADRRVRSGAAGLVWSSPLTGPRPARRTSAPSPSRAGSPDGDPLAATLAAGRLRSGCSASIRTRAGGSASTGRERRRGRPPDHARSRCSATARSTSPGARRHGRAAARRRRRDRAAGAQRPRPRADRRGRHVLPRHHRARRDGRRVPPRRLPRLRGRPRRPPPDVPGLRRQHDVHVARQPRGHRRAGLLFLDWERGDTSRSADGRRSTGRRSAPPLPGRAARGRRRGRARAGPWRRAPGPLGARGAVALQPAGAGILAR